MNILVCDDEINDINQITKLIHESHLEDCFDLQIKALSDPRQIRNEVKLNKYDLAYLDIEMNEVNGLDIAKQMIQKNPLCTLVFITHHTNYITDALELPIRQYLCKPINKEQLIKTLEYGIYQYRKHHDKIIIRTKTRQYSICINDIYYIETYYKNIIIHTTHDTYECHIYHLGEIMDQINPFDFYKIHQSYYINYTHVYEVQKDQIVLDNDTVLPMSLGLRKQIKDTYYQYLLRNKTYDSSFIIK